MLKSIAQAGRFVLLWLLCPLIALATARVLFGGVAEMMDGFVYHAELRPIAFFGHIILASIALALVPFQFWHGLRKTRLEAHRWIGRIYGLSIVAAGIAGLWLAVTTHSGTVAAWGFALLAIAWVGATVYGIMLAMQHRVSDHQRWMIRSAALTMAGVTLRIQLGLGAVGGYSYDDMVGFLGWSCWLPNLIVAEIVIRRNFQKRLVTITRLTVPT
ncbi:DUF2306 domain-containing protein [Rhizobium sp. XQZ8]|uniref:DUF2306 domain-containing protein n=1 Tax=Rhizobium populisoli TaxID=2859785 RepID=UPI001C671FD0|nr:DUF2306 domain-containing protein [Rhizobium populisoli]MBW6424210.1 DUF2306 domain-containing protein [Rhizobium populisoli]